MTHDAKSCFERERKVGAKFTWKYIAADEKIESFKLEFASKRGRWNGYDTLQYCCVQDKKFEGHALMFISLVCYVQVKHMHSCL